MRSDRIKAPNNLDNYGKSRSLNRKIDEFYYGEQRFSRKLSYIISITKLFSF